MTNDARANRVLGILREYYEDEPETDLIDLLTDIRHLCDQQGLEFQRLDRVAHHHYTVENVAARAGERE